MKINSILASLSVASVIIPAAPAWASPGPVGQWRIADGNAIVDIRPCGTDLCGYVASDTSQDSNVGQQVFNMRPDGEKWTGMITDLTSGQRYAGHIALVDEARLKVEGCIMGGFFCGGQQWSRVK
ncbi:MAG TPA: DUF2147 domain-containing protein [Methylovirgula sp.]|jgi:uncharacterized protein (DUF2147 family)